MLFLLLLKVIATSAKALLGYSLFRLWLSYLLASLWNCLSCVSLQAPGDDYLGDGEGSWWMLMTLLLKMLLPRSPGHTFVKRALQWAGCRATSYAESGTAHQIHQPCMGLDWAIVCDLAVMFLGISARSLWCPEDLGRAGSRCLYPTNRCTKVPL